MSDCLVERDGHTLIVTMNRPEARNALSTEMMQIMSEAWDEVNANPDIRVAILTGAGGHFCAGADLKGFAASDPGKGMTEGERQGSFDPTYLKPLLKGFLLDKPLIAAVEGYAVAGGTEILQGTDIRVAGESAQFAVAEVRWGLFPVGGSTVRLRRQIPYTVAMDILLTARPVSAHEALSIGLIGRVVPDGHALEEALKIADVINANGPLAVEAIKRSVRETEGLPEDEALKVEYEIGWPIFATEDAKEGPRA